MHNPHACGYCLALCNDTCLADGQGQDESGTALHGVEYWWRRRYSVFILFPSCLYVLWDATKGRVTNRRSQQGIPNGGGFRC